MPYTDDHTRKPGDPNKWVPGKRIVLNGKTYDEDTVKVSEIAGSVQVVIVDGKVVDVYFVNGSAPLPAKDESDEWFVGEHHGG